LADLLRQSVYSRIDGYEDINDTACDGTGLQSAAAPLTAAPVLTFLLSEMQKRRMGHPPLISHY